jgi:hypothetical protein
VLSDEELKIVEGAIVIGSFPSTVNSFYFIVGIVVIVVVVA